LELESGNQPVFIPVLPSGKEEGGVLMISTGDLQKQQNQVIIKAFLTYIRGHGG